MTDVVGTGEVSEAVLAALGDGRRRSATATPESDVAPVVAAGEAAVIDLVSAGHEGPVVPVGVEGLPSVEPEDIPAVLSAHADGTLEARSHPLLAVATEDGSAGVAAFDVMLVRGEPGRISEFGLSAGKARARFRADGVVVATPAGSVGYASAAGGPHLQPGSGSVAVVPVAAFGLGAPTWVVEPGAGIELRVERDEGDVALLLDGRERGRLAGPSAVELTLGGTLETLGPSA